MVSATMSRFSARQLPGSNPQPLTQVTKKEFQPIQKTEPDAGRPLVVLSEAKDLCIAAAGENLYRSFARLRMTRLLLSFLHAANLVCNFSYPHARPVRIRQGQTLAPGAREVRSRRQVG